MKDIFNSLKNIALKISNELKYADLSYLDQKNQTGDTQLKLDVKSDMIIEEELKKLSSLKSLVSEEKNEEMMINKNAKYIIAYDPLDGSSIVDVNFAVGSIFAIYEDELKASKLVASAYIIYGTRLELVWCKNEVELYRLNKDKEFVFIKNLTLKEKGKLNSTGGTQKNWSKIHKEFVSYLFDEGYRLRYSGAMISDLHQILLKGGGIFTYPSTSDAPNGKLRILFEILPMAYIFQKASGKTTNGLNESLMDLKVDFIHQTSPCFFGSSYEIGKLKEFYARTC